MKAFMYKGPCFRGEHEESYQDVIVCSELLISSSLFVLDVKSNVFSGSGKQPGLPMIQAMWEEHCLLITQNDSKSQHLQRQHRTWSERGLLAAYWCC